jgi:hypothetical protein
MYARECICLRVHQVLRRYVSYINVIRYGECQPASCQKCSCTSFICRRLEFDIKMKHFPNYLRHRSTRMMARAEDTMVARARLALSVHAQIRPPSAQSQRQTQSRQTNSTQPSQRSHVQHAQKAPAEPLQLQAVQQIQQMESRAAEHCCSGTHRRR